MRDTEATDEVVAGDQVLPRFGLKWIFCLMSLASARHGFASRKRFAAS